jgi:hypothetical protein
VFHGKSENPQIYCCFGRAQRDAEIRETDHGCVRHCTIRESATLPRC